MHPGDGVKILVAATVLGLGALGFFAPHLRLAVLFALVTVSVASMLSKEL